MSPQLTGEDSTSRSLPIELVVAWGKREDKFGRLGSDCQCQTSR